MTLNTMLYSYVHEGVETMSIDEFRKICEENELELELEPNVEHPVEPTDTCFASAKAEYVVSPYSAIPKGKFVMQKADPCYIRWQMFDEIPERVYTIECEGYVDKNGNPLDDEDSIKHLTNGNKTINIPSFDK